MAATDQSDARYTGPRHHPAHIAPIVAHNRPVILHVTVVTVGAKPILANATVQAALCAAWRAAEHWLVGTYMLMPEHVHLFCAPGRHDFPAVRDWAGYWKRLAGDNLSGLRSAFVRDCWDTQMRDQAHYLRKLEYVRGNRVRRGLVAKSEDWPYQGTLHPLDWIGG